MAKQPDLFPTDPSVLRTRTISFLLSLLNGRARPSARELLRALERGVAHNAGEVFVEVLSELSVEADLHLRRADRQYLGEMVHDGSAYAALRGERDDDDEAVSSIDTLLRQSIIYRHSGAFNEMITFMGRFRDYAPYNVMLVRLQNPSCSFFATEKDWRVRHQRRLIDNARPMIILAPMHPVLLVYDLDQTFGPALPSELEQFAQFTGILAGWRNWNKTLYATGSRSR